MEGGAPLSGEKAEATTSYTYWVREASTDAASLPVPKKIGPADLYKQPNQAHLGSAWNRAGTWEENFLNKWATDRIKRGVAWIAHIVIYLLIDPPLSAFLNEIFIKLDDIWGLLGTAAFAFFCFYLQISVIAGAMMIGLKLVFITIHPMTRRCEQWLPVRSSDIGNKLSSNYYTAPRTVIHVQDHEFIRSRISGFSRVSLFNWLKSFFKQFFRFVSKSYYTTLRLGFVMNHCSGNPKFNFYKYMTRALENDFKKVIEIR
ncbi:hypothetical protein ACS0TY_027876 [Phlomoides rotata]